MFVKGLVLLLLAVVAVESVHLSRHPFRRLPVVFPQSVSQESASSLGGAQVGTYSRTRGRPAFIRSRFPTFFPQVDGAEEYATSLGGAPVGLFNRNQGQGQRLVRARLPLRQQALDSEYATSLGGAPVGLYNRNQGQGRRLVRARLPFRQQALDSEYAASLGGADVGLYRRNGNGGYGRTDVSGASLGKAPVGFYGRE